MSQKAFEIYMGHAGEDTDFTRSETHIDGTAFERTLVTRDVCTDVMVTRQPSWLARTISSVADRAQLPRIARG